MQNLPTLNGNWVDLILIVIGLFYLWDGFRRGFILSFLDLASFILSFIFAVKFYDITAFLLISNFSLPRGIANAAGFLIMGFVFEIFLSALIHKVIKHIPPSWLGSKIENLLGVFPAIGNAAIISAFILTLIVTLPVKGSMKSDIVNSKLGGLLIRQTQGLEKDLNQIFGGAIEESLTFLTIKPESGETISLNFTQKDLTIDQQAEEELFELVNQERRKKNLKLLKFNTGKLKEVARDHAKDMFQRGFFSHYNPEGESPFDRMDKAGITYKAAGENLALAPTVILAHQGLMNSPGHRENILSSDFGEIGIGVIDGGIYGKMFVQEFMN